MTTISELGANRWLSASQLAPPPSALAYFQSAMLMASYVIDLFRAFVISPSFNETY